MLELRAHARWSQIQVFIGSCGRSRLGCRQYRCAPMPGSMAMCAVCGADSASSKLLKCGRCKLVWYCCKAHQVKDWKAGHKVSCVRPGARAAAHLEPAPTTVLFEMLDSYAEPYNSTYTQNHNIKLAQQQGHSVPAGSYPSGLWSGPSSPAKLAQHPCPSEAADIASMESKGEWHALCSRHFGPPTKKEPLATEGASFFDAKEESLDSSAWQFRYEEALPVAGGSTRGVFGHFSFKPFDHRFVECYDVYKDGELFAGGMPPFKHFKFGSAEYEANYKITRRYEMVDRLATPDEYGRIAFVGPQITLDQGAFVAEQAASGDLEHCPPYASALGFSEQTFAAPAGQSYFTSCQIAAVLHAYFYRPADRRWKAKGEVPGVDSIVRLAAAAGGGGPVYGVEWL